MLCVSVVASERRVTLLQLTDKMPLLRRLLVGLCVGAAFAHEKTDAIMCECVTREGVCCRSADEGELKLINAFTDK